MTSHASDSFEPPFDRVEVTIDGEAASYSYSDFMALQLAKRIRLILAGQPTFFSGDTVIEKKKALALG